MKAKLAALLIGLLLLGAAHYFRAPAKPAETVRSEEEEPAPRGRPANPLARPPVFQTVAFHPATESYDAESPAGLPPLSREEAVAHWNSISVLVTCATSPSACEVPGLPDSDPSARFFSLRDRILDELDWFLAHRAAPDRSAALVQAAQSLLAVPDDQIQCRSLDLLLTQPASGKTPELIARHMGELVDADCVQKLVRVLRRSLDSSNSRTVTDYVCHTILYGATFSSREMARNVGAILTDETRGPLEACMAKLPRSERYRSMRDALYPPTAI